MEGQGSTKVPKNTKISKLKTMMNQQLGAFFVKHSSVSGLHDERKHDSAADVCLASACRRHSLKLVAMARPDTIV